MLIFHFCKICFILIPYLNLYFKANCNKLVQTCDILYKQWSFFNHFEPLLKRFWSFWIIFKHFFNVQHPKKATHRAVAPEVTREYSRSCAWNRSPRRPATHRRWAARRGRNFVPSSFIRSTEEVGAGSYTSRLTHVPHRIKQCCAPACAGTESWFRALHAVPRQKKASLAGATAGNFEFSRHAHRSAKFLIHGT